MRRLQERLEATIRRAALAEDESDERILALTAIQGLTEILLILLQLVWRRQHPEAADPLPEADDPPPKHTYTKHKDTDDDFHSDDEPASSLREQRVRSSRRMRPRCTGASPTLRR